MVMILLTCPIGCFPAEMQKVGDTGDISPFGQFWVIFGPFWAILDHFGSILGYCLVLIFLDKNVSLLFLLLLHLCFPDHQHMGD